MRAESELGVAVVVGLFSYAVGAAGYIPGEKGLGLMIALGAAGATLIAAYQGAAYAFRLQNERADRERVDARHAAANRALFALFYYWNRQRQYQRTVIDEVRGKPDAWYNLPVNVSATDVRADLLPSDLYWLLQLEGEGANFYAEIMQAEDRYTDLLYTIRRHEEFTRLTLDPALRNLGLIPGVEFAALAPLAQSIEPTIYVQAKLLADALIRHTDNYVRETRDLYERFRAAMDQEFPETKLIKFEPTDDSADFNKYTVDSKGSVRELAALSRGKKA